MAGDIEIMHASQYFSRLISEGKLKLRKKVAGDGHLSGPVLPRQEWVSRTYAGRAKQSPVISTSSIRQGIRRGTYGVYQPPRDLLGSVPA